MNTVFHQSMDKRLIDAKRKIINGDLEEAREINASLLAEHPEHTGALIQRSRIESFSGNYRSAREYALRAAATNPTDAPNALNLLQRLQTFNLTDEIHRLIANLSPLQSQSIPLLDAIAVALNHQNEPALALGFLEKGLSIDPNSTGIILSRAEALMFLGRFSEAEQELHQCLKKAPTLAFGWWTLSRIRRQTQASNHVEALRKRLSVSTHNPQDTVFLAYALHKELDDLGDTEGAIEALALAIKTKRSHIRYSSVENRVLFSQLMALPIPSPTQSYADTRANRTPLFIVGMHRSGTTLLEQLLDGHPDVLCAGEIYNFTTQMRYATDHYCRGEIDGEIIKRASGLDYKAIGAGYLASVERLCRTETHFTDKLPSNFLNIGFICQALAGAKILHMVRDPMETCFSNLRELFSDSTNLYSYDQLELADYYRQYRQLMAHWHKAFPGRILDVGYARLTGDTEQSLREISAFCGLQFDSAMLDPAARTRAISTASAVQARNKITIPSTPKWTPYRDYLSPLIGALPHGES